MKTRQVGIWRILSRMLPFAVLLFCLVNWFYSQRACWWIEMGSLHYAHLDHHFVRKGLYSEQGVLMFANSHRYHVAVGTRPPDWKTRMVTLAGTGFDVGYSVPPSPWSPTGNTWTRRACIRTWRHAAIVHNWGFSKLGFTALWQPDSGGFLQRGMAIPWWFLTAIFAITPAKRLIAWRGAVRSARAGLCASCGYDLRATPNRCPECGQLVPSEQRATSSGAPRLSELGNNQ